MFPKSNNEYVAEGLSLHNGDIKSPLQKIPPININDYPAIKEHLDSFEPALSARQDKGKTQYNLRNCAYVDEFKKDKIVYSEIVREPQFYLDKSGEFFAEASSFLMTGSNLKYIIGLLNSKFVTFVFKNYYAGGGLGETGYRYKKAFLENLPIPTLDTPEKKEIAGQIEVLVEQILKVKSVETITDGYLEDKNGDEGILRNGDQGIASTSEIEQQIDELVFELYGLSDEEKGLVLGK